MLLLDYHLYCIQSRLNFKIVEDDLGMARLCVIV